MKSTLIGCGLAFALALAGSAYAQETGKPAPRSASPEGEAGASSTFDELLQAELGVAGGLTANDVAARALGSSPLVRVRNEELLAAAAEVDRATWAYLPKTSLTARYTRLSDLGNNSLGNLLVAPGAPAGGVADGTQLVNVPLDLATPLNQYTFQASIVVPVSDYFLRVGPARDVAKLDKSSAAQNLSAQKGSTAADARLTYYGWVRARLNVIVAEQALLQSRAHLAEVQAQLVAGTASKADVLRVESQLAQSELLVVSSQNLSALTEEQLRTLLDAETDLTRARLDALGARIDARAASVRLAYALGRADAGAERAPLGAPRTPAGSMRGKLFLAAAQEIPKDMHPVRTASHHAPEF